MKTVSVGLASKVGYGITALCAVATFLSAIGVNLHLSPEAWGILTSVWGVPTGLGRMHQATKL